MLKINTNKKFYNNFLVQLANKRNHDDYQKTYRRFMWHLAKKTVKAAQTVVFSPSNPIKRNMSYSILKDHNLPEPKKQSSNEEVLLADVMEDKKSHWSPHPKVVDNDSLKEPAAYENTWIALTDKIDVFKIEKDTKCTVIDYECIGNDPQRRPQMLIALSATANITHASAGLKNAKLTEYWQSDPVFIEAVERFEKKLIEKKYNKLNEDLTNSLTMIHQANKHLIVDYDDPPSLDWSEETKHMKNKLQQPNNNDHTTT